MGRGPQAPPGAVPSLLRGTDSGRRALRTGRPPGAPGDRAPGQGGADLTCAWITCFNWKAPVPPKNALGPTPACGAPPATPTWARASGGWGEGFKRGSVSL